MALASYSYSVPLGGTLGSVWLQATGAGIQVGAHICGERAGLFWFLVVLFGDKPSSALGSPPTMLKTVGVGAGARMSFLLGFDSPTLGQKVGGTEAVTW